MQQFLITSGEVSIRYEDSNKVTIYDRITKLSLEGNYDFGLLLSACNGRRTYQEIENWISSQYSGCLISSEKLQSILASLQNCGIVYYTSEPEYKPLRVRKTHFQYPLDTVYLEPTRKCNLRCIHCYANAPSFSESNEAIELSEEKLNALLRELEKIGVIYICFTGGEPFMHPRFLEVLQYCHSLGLEIAIFTNGTLLSSRDLSILAKIKPAFVAISLDSHRKETYQFIRGKDSLKGVLQNLSRLLEADVHVRINCILFRGLNDSQSELKNYLRLLKEYGVSAKSITFDQFSPEGEGATKRKYLIDEEIVVQRVKQAFADVYQYEVSSNNITPRSPKKGYDFCGLGTSMLNITSLGEITLCPALNGKRHEVARLDEVSIKQAWENSDLLQYFRSNSHVANSECFDCPWIDVCCGGCKAKALTFSGRFNAIDPWMCAFFNSNQQDH